jgi:hypothetical protein
MRICGYGMRQAGGGVSPFPSAKAYFGPLPASAEGIEFTTNVRPCSVNPRQGGSTFWYQSNPQAHLVNGTDGPMVCIDITTIRLVYP